MSSLPIGQVLCGDCLDIMRGWPDNSVDCCVTSPPYFGLRDYGVEGQLGLESTVGEYIGKMVEIFEEVRRVLKPSGTLFLNMGDSYASGKGTCYNPGGGESSLGKERKEAGAHPLDRGNKSTLAAQGLKPKDLCMIPARLALALQDAGWWLRSDIIWAKPNPMPESVTDRPTSAHEHIFLLAKSGKSTCWQHEDGRWAFTEPEPEYYWRSPQIEDPDSETEVRGWSRRNRWSGRAYYYDAAAIAEPVTQSTLDRCATFGRGTFGLNKCAKPEGLPDSYQSVYAPPRFGGTKGADPDGDLACNRKYSGNEYAPSAGATRNSRNVWEIATRPFKQAHFATFPPELPRRCILAGCPQGGIVLDPFFGSGTVGMVAQQLARQFIGIELNPEYCAIARKRTAQKGLALEVAE